MPSRVGSTATAEPYSQTLLQGSQGTVSAARPEPGKALAALGPSFPSPSHPSGTDKSTGPSSNYSRQYHLPGDTMATQPYCQILLPVQPAPLPAPTTVLTYPLSCPPHCSLVHAKHPCPGSRHGHHIQGPTLAPGMLRCTERPRMLSKLWARVTTCSYPSPLCTAEMPMEG